MRYFLLPTTVPDSTQGFLDFDAIKWPLQHLMPINWSSPRRRVEPFFLRALRASSEYAIITGFTSLSELVVLFGGNMQELPPFRDTARDAKAPPGY